MPRLGGDNQLDSIRTDIEATMEELAPGVKALEKFRPKYAQTADLEGLTGEREALRGAVQQGVDRLRDQLQEFRTIRKEDQFKRGTLIISKFLSGEEGSKVEEDLKAVLDLGEYPHKIQRFMKSAKDALLMDQRSYRQQVMLRKAAQRRRMLLVFGGIGAAALAAFIIFLIRLRRIQRPRTLTGIPVQPAPAGAAPGQHPAVGMDTPVPAVGMHTPRPALAGPHTPAPVAPIKVGDVLGGNYKIVKELGKGSLGPVYEARETATGKKTVVKRIREELHRSDKDLERFLAQARYTAALKHTNLAEVYSVFLEEERVHLALEFVDGMALSRFLDSGQRINLTSIQRVFGQIAAVLDHAHSKKIIHGDLKPSNVMVMPDGTAKVLDFGIGLEARKTAAKLSWSEALGSPAYMAPEQELGTTFKESDLYSLGVLFYEMVTGRLPFDGPNFLAQKREMRYHPPSRLSAEFSKDFDNVVRKALQAEPQYRFRKAADLFSAVNALRMPAAPQHAPKKAGG